MFRSPVEQEIESTFASSGNASDHIIFTHKQLEGFPLPAWLAGSNPCIFMLRETMAKKMINSR
jgi:hypothetical protein